MAKRCATRDELLALVPEFKTYGSLSTGQLTVSLAAVTGTFTLDQAIGNPLPAQEVFTAGVNWTNGATPADTATAIAAAISAGSLATASAIGAVVHVASVSTGLLGVLGTTTASPELAWAAAELAGGNDAIDEALNCTCSMINLDCWGDKASCAHIYLAAHFIATAAGGVTGPTKREKIDKIEVEHAILSFGGSDNLYSTTPYGLQYLAMKRTLFIGPMNNRRTLVCL